jgi:hypothetical protein
MNRDMIVQRYYYDLTITCMRAASLGRQRSIRAPRLVRVAARARAALAAPATAPAVAPVLVTVAMRAMVRMMRRPMVGAMLRATVLLVLLVFLVLPRVKSDRVHCSAGVCIQLTCQVLGWRQPLPTAHLLWCPALRLQVCCQQMRRLRRPRGTNQVHGRLQLDHRVHRVGRMLAHHSPVVGRGSPVADALHTVGWDHDSLAAGVAAVGREKCCGLGRSLAGTAHAEGHHSHVGEAARRDRAMVEGTGSARTLALVAW